jgi:predicted protein tyrosine phosphatase
VLSNEPFGFNTRAAGVSVEYALVPVDDALIFWADEIVCMEEWQSCVVSESEQAEGKAIHTLCVPDSFSFRDPELINIIKQQALKIFNKELN